MMPFGGASVSIEVTRNAHGRNNYITFEIYGDKGSIAFNYERMDEIEEMFAEEADDARGFRTVYTGPADPYGRALWPIPALGIGYGETKIIECHDFVRAIVKGQRASPSFHDGWRISEIADSILKSGETQAWVVIEGAKNAAWSIPCDFSFRKRRAKAAASVETAEASDAVRMTVSDMAKPMPRWVRTAQGSPPW